MSIRWFVLPDVAAARGGRNMRAVMNGVMYILSTGCSPSPLHTGAIPQWAPVGTQKAGTSTDDGLKATILVADDPLRSVIVLRTKNQDCFAIDFSNPSFHCCSLSCWRLHVHDHALQALASRSTVNEIAEPPHFLVPEDARGVPSFARAFVHR
jgi:hypothetical protein